MGNTSNITQKIDKVEKSIKGGRRPGSGRKAGVKNRRNAALVAAVEATGITPLEFMLKVMREPDLPGPPDDADAKTLFDYLTKKLRHDEVRMDAAKGAAPYVHAKLASVEVSGKGGGPLQVHVVDYSSMHKK